MINAYATYSNATLKGTVQGAAGGSSGGTSTSETLTGSVAVSKNVFHGPYGVVPGTRLRVAMTGTNDPDLYVRFGAQPTTASYHCRPYLSGPTETCELTVPEGQSSVYVMVRGYASSTYTLNIDYTKP